ncbi:MAG: hypothetical protein JO273_04030 [Methylobacteriaceae bacterium]|nr:hypothetical protein [Methylobacteriaceae bacterium]
MDAVYLDELARYAAILPGRSGGAPPGKRPLGKRADGPPTRLREAVSAPLACLAGGALTQRFHAWRGATGKRYVFSVFPLCPDLPEFEDAVMLAVGVATNGRRRILHADETGPVPQATMSGAMLRARRSGACEVHFHLLARTASARRAILGDLAGA